MITTAGHGGHKTLCRSMHDRATKALAGGSDDQAFYAAIFATDPREDWRLPATWFKANPSLGDPDRGGQRGPALGLHRRGGLVSDL